MMAEHNVLPKISEATRQKLNSYGFTNHLYDYLNLPSVFIPRATGFDAYTYLIMAISAAGGLLASRYGFTRLPFATTFVVAPFAAFYQKKEADFNHTSQFSKRHPSLTLQFFPKLNQAFKQVSAEADEEISRYQERVRVLEERVNRQATKE